MFHVPFWRKWGRFFWCNFWESSSTLNMVVKNVNRDCHLMKPVDTPWHSIRIRNSWESGGNSVNDCHGVLWIRPHRGHDFECQMVNNEAIWLFCLETLPWGGHGRTIAAEPGSLDKDWGKFAWGLWSRSLLAIKAPWWDHIILCPNAIIWGDAAIVLCV